MNNISSSNSQKALVPELRFPEFVDNWTTKKISDILEIKHGKDYKSESAKYGTYPVIGTGGVITYIDSFLCDWDCVCIGRKGTINKPIYMDEPFWSVDTLFYTKPLCGVSKFQYYLFERINWLSYNEASGVPSLSASTIKRIEVNIPSFDEQNKIVQFLSLIDKKIDKQQQLIDTLKLYKRGVENLYFSKKYNNHYRLEDVLIERNEKSTKNNEHDVISSTKNGLFKQCDYFNKQASSEDTTGYKIIRREQIVFSPQNLWMGNINYNDSYDVGIVSPSYKIFDINDGFDKYYIACLMKSSQAINEYVLASEQGASIVRRNLNMELFLQITFSIPEFEEQIKISKHLKLLNNQLNHQDNMLKALLTMKQGLLQKMFI